MKHARIFREALGLSLLLALSACGGGGGGNGGAAPPALKRVVFERMVNGQSDVFICHKAACRPLSQPQA